MSELRWVLFGAAFAWSAILLLPERLHRRLMVRNYRGTMVPATLGIPLAISSILVGVLAQVGVVLGGGRPSAASLWLLLAATIVWTAGLLDDLAKGGARGLRSHLAELRRGRATTGQLKLVAAVAGGIAFVWGAGRPGGLVQKVLGVVLVAAATNLWNGLDVAPGRAIKAFVLVAVPMTVIMWPGSLLLRMLGGALVVGWFDLRERGMLGDSGSNLLGFGAGVILYAHLTGWALWLGAAAGVILNLLAETLTLSRPIRGFPLTRWLDDLGRVGEADIRPDSSSTV